MAENRGVVYVEPGKVEVRDIPYPKLINPKGRTANHGVILKVLTTNICGSDQHMVRGRTTAPAGLASRASATAFANQGATLLLPDRDAKAVDAWAARCRDLAEEAQSTRRTNQASRLPHWRSTVASISSSAMPGCRGRQHGIRAKGKRRFKITNDSNHGLPGGTDLQDWKVDVAGPDKASAASSSAHGRLPARPGGWTYTCMAASCGWLDSHRARWASAWAYSDW